ncbi:baseplate J/gp47 family protein [Robbsia andropogonis]|uniref:baseplate J/gp47 family protein n=1 Tax=Robbsia andropogonis TaxID=28092 RepID=UPI002A6B70DD|nr:baseplate J/gp47 family protein [Robbsia andropogonis]
MTIPLVMSTSGPQTTTPATLRSNLLAAVSASNSDYTANLPGSLIEDIASTQVGALSMIDQARVDAVNSVTPYGANAFVLAQQGTMLGIPQGGASNTSVYVVISGPAGYIIPAGFIVSDGSYQYQIQDGGVILTSGSTNQLYAVATTSGSWAVAQGAVNTIITSVQSGYTLTVTNPQAGTAGDTDGESVQDYRSRILEAATIAGQGTPAYLYTLLKKVSGVTPRLVAILQAATGWEVICGGGDSYDVAAAIYAGTLDLSTIVGSNTVSRNISVTLTDSPNQYTIPYVNPPQQTVTVTTTWNTNLSNFSAGAQVNQLGAPSIVSYINGITVGQPINLLEMQNAFQSAVSSVLPTNNLTTLTFTVYVNGSVVSPATGTSMITSDTESYFYCSSSGATVSQG